VRRETLFKFTHQLFTMQLPRGKFRSVIKGVALNSLIQELAEVRYSGVITISWNHEVISIVMQRGRYILAEYGSLRGDSAWEGVTGLGESTIDAILSDFSEAELKLATEFNAPCLLPAPASPRAAKASREKSPPPPPREEAHRPATPPALPVKPVTTPLPPAAPVPLPGAEAPPAGEPPAEEAPALSPPTVWTPVDMAQAMAAVAEQGGTEVPGSNGYDELALLHMEMSALDDVDVEHIATKIRKNARGIVKKLHLGHLMTEKEE
jgi:hypothetical protein